MLQSSRKRLIVDLETDGLLPELTKIHSLVLRDRDDPSWVFSCTDSGDPVEYHDVQSGLHKMAQAEVLYAHNGLAFDFPAIEKVTGRTFPNAKIIDTLILARLAFTNQKEDDYLLFKRGKLPGHLIGSHKLEAWGWRLRNLKDVYDGGWERWTPAMQSYCEQDTSTTYSLIEHCAKHGHVSAESLDCELALAAYLVAQENNGWPFDSAKAQELQGTLAARRHELGQQLRAAFKPWVAPKGKPGVWKRDNKKTGAVKGASYQHVQTVEFNPASRAHIANRLTTLYGWVPEKHTETGKPQVDETVLEGLLHIPEVKLLQEYLLVEKRLGQLAEGEQAWLKLMKPHPILGGEAIFGRMNQLGAITHRATHSSPNISQVPAVTAPYGTECRGLFIVPQGWQMMGADASGLELRCLAHYMASYDGGAYGKILLEADVHTANQIALGEFVPDGKEGRNLTKTWSYALLYGAGDEKLGRILKPELKPEQQQRLGKASRNTFLKNTPALKYLLRDVQAATKKRGYFTVLDGRRVHVRSEHAALNTLLQSAGAVICKHWIVGFADNMDRHFGPQGWGLDNRWAALGWIHDEIQVGVRPEAADIACGLAVECIEHLTERFSFKCPLTGEAHLGASWAETH